MITVQGNQSLSKLLTDHADKVPAIIHDILARLGVMGEGQMKRITPVDTGNLRKRISHVMPTATEVHIGTNVTYGLYILGDVAPFTVRAKNKKVLAWVTRGHVRPSTPEGWKEARRRGWARYAKQLRHPGGVDALGKTEQYVVGQIPSVVEAVLKKYGVVGQ
jgi:hypothetical protein